MTEHTTGDLDEYESYYRQVELQWSLTRGRQIIVSPLEFEAIESWYEAGIPLPVVLRAIELFIEKKQKAKRKKGFLLKDAASTVEKCWREYVDLHTGEGDDSDQLVKKLKALITKIGKLAKSFPESATFVEELRARMKQIDTSDVVAFDDLDANLAELELGLVDHFSQKLSEDERAEIRDDVSEFLTEDEDPEFFQKMLHEAVRTHFGLPRLTLLG